MDAAEVGAWRSCPTEIDSPIRVFSLWRPYQLGLAIAFWFIWTHLKLHPGSGMVGVLAPVAYLSVCSLYADALAPRFLLHGLHYLQLIPTPNGFLVPKRIAYSIWDE